MAADQSTPLPSGLDGPGKYLRTLFSHSGFAFVLAEKLERAFPDDTFAVMVLSASKERIITRSA
jgi:hypothetical protein